MYNWVTGGGNCGENIETGNNAPTLEPIANKNIPKETPFVLTALAEDIDGDVLTYSFEQTDNQVAQMPPRSEEHTSELQSRGHLVCRLLLEKKDNTPPHL